MNIKYIFMFSIIAIIGIIVSVYGVSVQNDLLYGMGLVFVVQGIIGMVIIILRSE
jgi:hypothetical protein